MSYMYLLSHLRDGDDATFKLCGVYASEEAAAAALLRLRTKPGFRRYLDGFEISRYEVDRIYWADGFGFEGDGEEESTEVGVSPLRSLSSGPPPTSGGAD